MRAIMVMYDSLNRHMLEPYGSDWVKTPNFKRLAEKSVTFDNSYVGSMPCMPARREIHTGRYNFLHRSWGPIEPYDQCMPEILKWNGVHSHLASDHYHYWEEGGCNYHTRYSTWECVRGQEGDPWKGVVDAPPMPDTYNEREDDWGQQDWTNREYMDTPEKMSQTLTFDLGLEFIETNKDADNWFLQLETFDPHEPYFCHKKHQDLYPHDYDDKPYDWPKYEPTRHPEHANEHCRYQSAALHSMCDEQLGRVLDMMDENDMWKDTMLIVNTDHGFLLGEHDWWGKCRMPFYNEIANTPLFIWDPRSGIMNERRQSLVQTIDLPATILEFFGIERPEEMQGVPLKETIKDDTPARQAGLFGLHGAHVNVTDGRYVYMRSPVREDNQPLNNYTLMPTHMRRTFGTNELQNLTLAEPFDFTQGVRTLRVPCGPKSWSMSHEFGHLLFDNKNDRGQEKPIEDAEVEKMMIEHLRREMKANDAPPEQFIRLGLDIDWTE